MAEKFEGYGDHKTKRRRCYYEFSKDYPGTRYDKNKRSSTNEELDSRVKVRKALAVVAVIAVFLLAFLVTSVMLKISKKPVDGLENVGATNPTVELTTDANAIADFIRDKTTAEKTTEEETTAEETTTEEDDYPDDDSEETTEDMTEYTNEADF